MSKNQLEKYLCFKYLDGTKTICKLIVTSKGDVFLGLPKISPDNEPTFLEKSTFPYKKIYDSSGIKYLSKEELLFKDISTTVNDFKLSYHPDGFTQFSGTGKIISGKDQYGNSKGFGYNTFPIDNMCDGPFMGMGFDGNLCLFEDQNSLKNNTILPIFKRGITNTYITSISNETNVSLELFIRKVGESNPRKAGIIVKEKEHEDDILGNFPHPDEGLFKLRIFIFEYNSEIYLLGARLLIREEDEYIKKEGLTYSACPATAESDDPNLRYRICCYHGKYWQDLFQSKINKTIDLE